MQVANPNRAQNALKRKKCGFHLRAVFGVKSCNWGGCEGVLVNCASEPPSPILLNCLFLG